MASAAADPSSPRSSRPTRWSHVVRGGESDASAAPSPPSPPPIPSPEPYDQSPSPDETSSSSSDAQPHLPASESPDLGADGNAAGDRGKKPAWKVPSNGAAEVGPVMGAFSWPALSESIKASPKSSSSDSLKALSDAASTAPPGPVISIPSPSPKPSVTIPSPNPIRSPNPSQKPPPPARQPSMKRTPANGGAAPPLSPSVSRETGKQTFPEPSPKGGSNKNSGSNWDHGSSKGGGTMPQAHGGNEHHRGHSGGRRGGGSHHNSYGNRREEWNRNRSFSSGDVHMQQQQPRGIRSYPRPAMPGTQPFISPPPQRLGSPMGYPDMTSMFYFPHPPPESIRSMPFVAHPPHALFFPPLDPQRTMLVKQIDYYFSNENLCKDIFLRQNMDEEGWVPIKLIAGFNRVKQLTNNLQYILDTVRLSAFVEVQDDKIRRRNDWMNWVLPPSNHSNVASGSQSPATPADFDVLTASLQTVGLEGAAANHSSSNMRVPSHNSESILTRSASGNLINQFQVFGDHSIERNVHQFGGRLGGSDRSLSARSLVRSDTL